MIYPFQGKYPRIDPSVFITDNVSIIGDVEILKDSSLWFGTVVRGDVNTISIGERTNIQDNSTLHVTWKQSSLHIGNDVTIGHAAILHGCDIGNSCLIGMGAKILDDAIIGDGSLIAAGTVVLEKFVVPAGVLVAGVPGRIVRELTVEEQHRIEESANHYLEYVGIYRRQGVLDCGISNQVFQSHREHIRT